MVKASLNGERHLPVQSDKKMILALWCCDISQYQYLCVHKEMGQATSEVVQQVARWLRFLMEVPMNPFCDSSRDIELRGVAQLPTSSLNRELLIATQQGDSIGHDGRRGFGTTLKGTPDEFGARTSQIGGGKWDAASNRWDVQSLGDGVEVLHLGHTTIIDDVIHATDGFIAGIAGFDQALCHVAHIDDGHDIGARTKKEPLARFDEFDEAAETGSVARAIDPARSYNHHRSSLLFDQLKDQLLARDLGATIGVILGVIGMLLGDDAMQMMSINGNGAGLDDALDSCIHCGRNQVEHSLHIGGVILLFWSPGSRFGGNVIDALHTLYCASERCGICQITLDNLNIGQCVQATSIFNRSDQCSDCIATFYQQINQVATEEASGTCHQYFHVAFPPNSSATAKICCDAFTQRWSRPFCQRL